MIVPFPPWRSARVEHESAQLRITLRPRSVVLQAGIFVLAFGLWMSGAMYGLQDLSVHPARRVWDAFGLLGWFAWGIYALPRLLAGAIGHETVVVSSQQLTIRRTVGPFERSRVFPLSQALDLHYELPLSVGNYIPPSRGWPALPPPALGGSIRFAFRGRSYRFALGVGPEDMAAILAAMRERVPVGSTGSARGIG